MRKITMILGLILVTMGGLYAQSTKKTITGKVTTETGEALSGVTVMEVGGAGKALTNEGGVYTKIPPSTRLLLRLKMPTLPL